MRLFCVFLRPMIIDFKVDLKLLELLKETFRLLQMEKVQPLVQRPNFLPPLPHHPK